MFDQSVGIFLVTIQYTTVHTDAHHSASIKSITVVPISYRYQHYCTGTKNTKNFKKSIKFGKNVTCGSNVQQEGKIQKGLNLKFELKLYSSYLFICNDVS